jgi:hypothetical protein
MLKSRSTTDLAGNELVGIDGCLEVILTAQTQLLGQKVTTEAISSSGWGMRAWVSTVGKPLRMTTPSETTTALAPLAPTSRTREVDFPKVKLQIKEATELWRQTS